MDLRAGAIGIRLVELHDCVESHLLPMSQVVTLGLIINKLVTNALKCAFPSGRAIR
jgi:two-component sensor histidine kinase